MLNFDDDDDDERNDDKSPHDRHNSFLSENEHNDFDNKNDLMRSSSGSANNRSHKDSMSSNAS